MTRIGAAWCGAMGALIPGAGAMPHIPPEYNGPQSISWFARGAVWGGRPAKNTLYGRGGQLDRDTRGIYNTGRGAGCRMGGTSRPKTRSEFRSWENLKIGYLKIHDPEKSAKKNYGLKKSRTFPPFLDSKILKFQKSGRSWNIKICKIFNTSEMDYTFIMSKQATPTKVHTYEKDTPKEYEKHPGRVRGWVPEGSPYAEHPRKKR